jgi:outer membrane protein assembly factor BamD
VHLLTPKGTEPRLPRVTVRVFSLWATLKSATSPSGLPAVWVGLLTCLLLEGAVRAEFVYRPGEGWSWEGGIFGSSTPGAKTAELQYKAAEDLEQKGDLAGAVEAHRKLIKIYPMADLAASSRFRLAGLLEKRGLYEQSFDAYDTYLAKHQDGTDFNAALDGMIRIAKRFMDGERRQLYGLKLFPSNFKAEQMFDSVLKRAPYSKSSARVMLLRGMMMERQGKDPEAIANYQQIIERFPGDPMADEAQYQIGFVRMRNVQRGSYDRVDRVRAQEAFEDYISRAPSAEKSSQARENLQRLEKNHLQSQLEVAKFYEKTGKIKSAAFYYQELVRESPSAPEAKVAQQRLEALARVHGADAVKLPKGPAENAEAVASKKRMEALINTVSRQDYVGPQLGSQLLRAEKGPGLRLSPADLEPPLPLPLTDPIVNPSGASSSAPPKKPADQPAAPGPKN